MQKREQKNQSERATAGIANRVKAAETQNVGLRGQNDALKRINDELSAQLKLERDARQREADQREAAQRSLRELKASTRVSTSQHDSLQRQLRDREDEIKKLRQLLTETRQRNTSALIPRTQTPTASPPMKKSRSSVNPENNQTEENEDPPAAQSSSSTRPKLSQSRSGVVRKPMGTRLSGIGATGRSSSSTSLHGADSPTLSSVSSVSSLSSAVTAAGTTRVRVARNGAPRWK